MFGTPSRTSDRRSPMRHKAERKWTVMLVPHGSGASRAVEVSQTVVKALAGFGSALALLFLVLGGAALSRGINITHSRALEHENRLLADEIQRLRERMVGLRDTLNTIGQREQELRLLAGLSPTDVAVQQAGIGGPAGTRSERDRLSPPRRVRAPAPAARTGVEAPGRRANIPGRAPPQGDDPLSRPPARHAREARAEGRARGLDRPFHRPAPALRGVGERQAGEPDEIRAAGRDRGLRRRTVGMDGQTEGHVITVPLRLSASELGDQFENLIFGTVSAPGVCSSK